MMYGRLCEEVMNYVRTRSVFYSVELNANGWRTFLAECTPPVEKKVRLKRLTSLQQLQPAGAGLQRRPRVRERLRCSCQST